ncbi:MAG: hypothetical protein ACM30I_09660 [Gemmatimonas sp.]
MADERPIPPENRSKYEPAAQQPPASGNSAQPGPKADERQRNLREQGRQGNIAQNTHNQGYQQNR